MMFTIEGAFNSIWRVSRPRPLARRILIYWATLTGSGQSDRGEPFNHSYLVGVSLGFRPADTSCGYGDSPVRPFCAYVRSIHAALPCRGRIAPSGVHHASSEASSRRWVRDHEAQLYALHSEISNVYVRLRRVRGDSDIPLWIYLSWVVIVIGALITALAPDFAVLREAARRPPGSGSPKRWRCCSFSRAHSKAGN